MNAARIIAEHFVLAIATIVPGIVVGMIREYPAAFIVVSSLYMSFGILVCCLVQLAREWWKK